MSLDPNPAAAQTNPPVPATTPETSSPDCSNSAPSPATTPARQPATRGSPPSSTAAGDASTSMIFSRLQWSSFNHSDAEPPRSQGRDYADHSTPITPSTSIITPRS